MKIENVEQAYNLMNDINAIEQDLNSIGWMLQDDVLVFEIIGYKHGMRRRVTVDRNTMISLLAILKEKKVIEMERKKLEIERL